MDFFTFLAENPGYGVVFALLAFCALVVLSAAVEGFVKTLFRWADPTVRLEKIRHKAAQKKNSLDSSKVDALCRLSATRRLEDEAGAKRFAEMSRLLELAKKYKLKLGKLDSGWPVVDENGEVGTVDEQD